MKHIFAALLLNCLFAQQVYACSPAQSGLFHPDENKAASYDDPVTGYSQKLPVLIVKEIEVIRGSGSDGFSCDDAGFLIVKMEIPQDSSYSFDDFGVYFRVVSGEDILAGHAYPLRPISKEGKVATFQTVWLDGDPSSQKALDVVIESFVISHTLQLGSAMKFDVKAGVGKK